MNGALPPINNLPSASHAGIRGHQGAGFRAIIRLFCDLQNARLQLFQPLAQVIHPLKFLTERQRNNKETP
jgi:hypothetical protein